MRRWLTVACVAATVCGACQVSVAQSLLNRQLFRAWIQNRARFELIGGRVIAGNGGWSFGNGAQSMSSGDEQERISFSNNGNGMSGTVVYNYQRMKTDAENHKRPVQEVAVEFSAEGRFLLRYKDADEPQRYFELLQVPGQPVQLSLPPADKPRVLQAATLWHLLVIHADDCRTGLVPGLEMVRPDWRLSSIVSAAENELVKLAAGAQKRDRQQWIAFVDQLGDPVCARRERAEKQLLDAGPAILSYLARLNTGRLDAEQQARIRRVIRTLSTRPGEDSPENIAALLVGDPYVWLALLSRDDESMRVAAAQQLEQILGAPLKVDPMADPATQAKAREDIRRQIEKLVANGAR